MSGRPVGAGWGKCEDRDAKQASQGLGEREGWRAPTFSSEICAPFSQVVDPFPGHTGPTFPAEVVVARKKD